MIDMGERGICMGSSWENKLVNLLFFWGTTLTKSHCSFPNPAPLISLLMTLLPLLIHSLGRKLNSVSSGPEWLWLWDLTERPEQTLGLVLHWVREQGRGSWQRPGHVRAAGYAAECAHLALPSSGCSNNSTFSFRGSWAELLDLSHEMPLLRALRGTEDLLKEDLAEGRKVGRTGSWNMPTQRVTTLPPFWHMSPSIPIAFSSNLHAPFSLSDCALNNTPPFCALHGFCFLFSLQALHHLSLCVLLCESCIWTHCSGVEGQVGQISGARPTPWLLCKGQCSTCPGFSPCGATCSSRAHKTHGTELPRWKRTRTAWIAELTLGSHQALLGVCVGWGMLLNSSLVC